MRKVEKKSIGYVLLRAYAQIINRAAYRSIYVNGLENIPRDKPIIFAPNHQNALHDPILVIFSTQLQPVFLARADIFKNKIVARILNYCKVAPVYRIRDGKESLEKNTESFGTSVRVLKNKRILALFPEGAHTGLKSMLPHKKAIPRIVFMAAENTNFDLDIQIVPVGINYTHYYRFRRSVVINYGKPLSSKNYYELYKTEGEVKASNVMRDDLYTAIDQLVVNVPEKAHYEVYEQAFEMAKPVVAKALSVKNNIRNFVNIEKQIILKISEKLQNASVEFADELQSKAKKYKQLKEKLNIEEQIIQKLPLKASSVLISILRIIAFLPFGIFGALVHGWIFYLTRYPVRKFIKDKQFYSTFAFALTLVFYPLWVIGLFFILLAFTHHAIIALLLLIISFPSGILAWELLQLAIRMIKGFKLKKIARKHPELLELHNELNIIYDQILSK